ncbi:MAG: HEAT repeat domain-containing protein, partial [Candidatus Methanofastidiosia archaeon]
ESGVRYQAVNYFATTGADDPKIKDQIFELLRDEESWVRYQAVNYFTTTGADDPKIKDQIFELLRDEESGVRYQAVNYFATTGADDPKIKNQIFELLRDETYSIFSNKPIQDIAVEFLSRHAREKSLEEAPNLYQSKDYSTKKGAYKLMKALFQSKEKK